ncbi:MAG TPA: fructose-6-phosphate aldolase, partial [Pelobium sp.]
DDHFTLLAYFRVDRPDKSLEKIGLADKAAYIMETVKDLPFGQILKLDI